MAEEMGHECRECKEWREHWYWTHLEHTRIRFSNLLTAGFDQRLVVPRKIVSIFRKQLVNRATIKTLSGKAWTIELEKRDEDLFFKQGWADFVRDHSLNEGDILIFQYEGDSTFAVSMFDSLSGYEKVGSGLPSNLETRQTNIHLESMNNTHDDFISLESEPSETESEDHNPSRKKARFADSSSKKCLRSTQLSSYSKGKSGRKKPKSIDTGKKIINLDKNYHYPLAFVSGRRPVSLAEKEKAHQLALAFRSTKPSFIVTMVPTSVSKRFFMTIPQAFVEDHMPRIVKEVVLCVPPGVKTWMVSYTVYMSHQVGLSGGWKSFVWDNNLEQDDVCVFELTQLPGKKNLETISMDVKIFRVVKKLDKLTEAKQFLRMKQEEGNATP
ncbi:hypothetical protein NE237_021004 [Protea cynaroides]|uniref:TF-B3 domain-containing protein n=1 Tax=Protea cynaroides TaxID=273540 RepID=A0A9Q0H8B5_9MAGN|nr:hypothetical protein NE237_021004 [Protea cynaroides]